MSKANFNEKLPEITAIPQDSVKKPNMPVGEAVQEAENLAAWAKEDKAALSKVGLDWNLLVDLPIRAGACRYAQSIWARESQSKEEAQKEWDAKSPEGFALRDKLLHDYTFAFRKQPDLLKKVQTIRECGSYADMLQDLSDLSVFGKENKALLKAIGMDLRKLAQAAPMADDLSVVLANANGEEGDEDNAKEMRDRAYTFMKMAMDEIRATGQYAFWRDADRRKGYVSNYHRRLNKRRKRDDSSRNDMSHE